MPCFTSGSFINHILPSLILRQRTVSAVQTDSSSVCVHAAVARTPTQKEVWNPLGSPAQSPHPPTQHNLQMSRGLPEPTRLTPSQDKGGQATGVVSMARIAEAAYPHSEPLAPLRALGLPTLACGPCCLLARMSAASRQRVDRFRMAAAAAMWVSSLRWPQP